MFVGDRVRECRICRSRDLVQVLDLGEQALTGVFPASEHEAVPSGPLELLWCRDCTLVQLSIDFQADEMYGDNYGYRSGLNESMVSHLRQIVRGVEGAVNLAPGDVVVDIGSNDGTLLAQYADKGLQRIGIDPTARKFLEHYDTGVTVLPDFFSADGLTSLTDTPASVVTSISMFYDLPDPVAFARDVHDCMDRDGLWLLEQSYMPSMVRSTSYDTVCHEHLEYYSMATLQEILQRAGMRLVDVRFNSTNGGSFSASVVRSDARTQGATDLLAWFADRERRMGFHTPAPFRDFEARVYQHRSDLKSLVETLVKSGKRVVGLGASTKGNVLLQFCGLGPDLIECIGDVNPYKHGRSTPGTGIPIVSEQEMRALNPDYCLVLPWHFRQGIIEREADLLARGAALIFPLPEIEIVGA